MTLLRNIVIGFLLFGAVITVFAVGWADMSNKYGVTASDTYQNHLNTYSEITDDMDTLTSGMAEDLTTATNDPNSVDTFGTILRGGYVVIKSITSLPDMALSIIVTFAQVTGIHPIFITVAMAALLIIIVFTIVSGVLNNRI